MHHCFAICVAITLLVLVILAITVYRLVVADQQRQRRCPSQRRVKMLRDMDIAIIVLTAVVLALLVYCMVESYRYSGVWYKSVNSAARNDLGNVDYFRVVSPTVRDFNIDEILSRR